MKEIWNKIDNFLGKVANWTIIVIIIVIIWILIEKQMVGRYMMYEDYYNQKVKSEHITKRLNLSKTDMIKIIQI